MARGADQGRAGQANRSTARTRQFPGVGFDYSQNIEDNINEALSGVRVRIRSRSSAPISRFDERIANEWSRSMGKVPGIVDIAVYRSLGQPNLLITPDRDACARYGLNVGDVAAVVQAAIGGQAVTQVLEGDRRFDLVVRWLPQYRQSLDAIRNIRVSIPDGGQVPLGAGRGHQNRRGRLVHLSRGVRALRAGALCECAAAICRAPSRTPRQAVAARSQTARGRASGVGGRVRRIAGRQSPPDGRGPVRVAADRGRALRRDHFADRYFRHHGADSGRLPGRHPRPDPHRHAIQRLGGGRLHFDFRHRRDGRHPAELLYPRAVGTRAIRSPSRSSWAPIAACAPP